MDFGLIHRPEFWKLIESILEAEAKVKIEEILIKTESTQAQLKEVLTFLNHSGLEISIENDSLIKKFEKEPVLNMKFSLTDWWRLQAHFPLLHFFKDKPFHQKLVEKLSTLESQNKSIDLFENTKLISNNEPHLKLVTNESSMELNLKQIIETGIKEKTPLNLKLKGHEDSFEIFPLKLTYLEGGLSLIGEEIFEKSLVFFPINKLENACITQSDYEKPIHGQYDVEEFIENIRFMNGNEIRLVLKILEPEKVSELVPFYHYLRKPYVISNPRGELIWAASVEETEDLFEWLSNLQSKVEILDPVSFKKNFLDFCEKKLKNIA